jgi:hypothetical protein
LLEEGAACVEAGGELAAYALGEVEVGRAVDPTVGMPDQKRLVDPDAIPTTGTELPPVVVMFLLRHRRRL